MQNKNAGYLAAVSMSLIVGFSFYFSKISLSFASPLEVLAHRFTAAAVFSATLLLLKVLPMKITREDFLKFLPFSIFYPILFFLLQIIGLTSVQSSLASIIQATTPFFTMILAALILKEKVDQKKIFFLLLSLSGILYISIHKGVSFQGSSVLGYAFLLFSSFSSAANFILVRKYARSLGHLKITVMAVFAGFIFFNGTLFIRMGLRASMDSYRMAFGTYRYLFPILFLGIPSTLFSSMLTNFSLTKLEASTMSVFHHLGTFVSIFAGVVLLKETLFFYEIIGSLLILLGVLGITFSGRK